MILFNAWAEPMHGFMPSLFSRMLESGCEDGYDRFARIEYSREHPDYRRVIAERMRSKNRDHRTKR